MADITDVSQVIQSALAEIGVSGDLVVDMEGQHVEKPLGSHADAVNVKVVVVQHLDERVPMHLWDDHAI